MKLCIDCKYYMISNCCHENNVTTSPVDGRIYSRQSAHYLRMESDYCGADAKWFEPKPDLEQPDAAA